LQTRALSVVFKSYDAGHEIIREMRPDVVQWLTRAADEH
jgi:predicted esterase